jgi:A/G-specific adenine glycosylase
MINQVQANLLKWYDLNKRDLPFRKDKDPYKIWISEVMLQQTRVIAMLGSYFEFLKELPSLNSLANAEESRVVSLWKGLGYYSRAKNLRKGAIYLATYHNSDFPRNLEDLLKVPGIGPYTARAILSIAYDLPFAVLDGNVKRVLSRLYYFEENINLPKSHKLLQNLADSFLNKNAPGDHNQAVMEIGALVCTPTPNCLACPLSKSCKAKSLGGQDKLPFTTKEKKKIKIEMKFFLLFNANKEIFLYSDSKRKFFKTIPAPPFIIIGENLDESYYEKNKIHINLFKSFTNSPIYLVKKHSITTHEITISYIIEYYNELIPFEHPYLFSSLENLEKNFPSSIAKKISNDIHKKKFFNLKAEL